MDVSRSRDDAPARRKFYLLTLCAGTFSSLLIGLITGSEPFQNYQDTATLLILLALVGCSG